MTCFVFRLWLRASWRWLKKNWAWLFLPVGLLLYLLGRVGRKGPVVSSTLSAAEDVRRAAAAEAAVKAGAAARERDDRLKEVDEAHRRQVAELTREQQEKADELRRDPDKLNRFLLDVGKDIRKK